MHIRKPQVTDLGSMATVANRSMFDDPISKFIAPHRHQHPESQRQGFLRRAKRRFYSGNHLLIAVTDENDPEWDGNEKVIGYLSATFTRQKTRLAKQSYFSWNNLELALLSLEFSFVDIFRSDRSVDLVNQAAFRLAVAQAYDSEYFAHLEDYWDVDFLGIDPAFHRRGIGSAMLRRVLDLAADEGVPVTLIASQMGRPMYKKAGFKDLGGFDLGVPDAAQAMIWYPPSSEDHGPERQ